jgi:hypothetical protein
MRWRRGSLRQACGKLAASVRKSSILFEKPNYDQENHRPDDGVDDLCDDAADENKAGQWQKPTCQKAPIMPTTMLPRTPKP